MSALERGRSRELICKALTDPNFRRLLQTNPAQALGVRQVTPEQTAMIKKMLLAIDDIDAKINSVAESIVVTYGAGVKGRNQ